MPERFSLTPLQHAMLVASTTRPCAGMYVEQWIVTLREQVDIAALRQAWTTVVARHAALRTVFEATDNGAFRQFVVAEALAAWTELDLTQLSPGDASAHRRVSSSPICARLRPGGLGSRRSSAMASCHVANGRRRAIPLYLSPRAARRPLARLARP
ncbi:MAG: condensation domain-containing protein [Pirellulales bacterium]